MIKVDINYADFELIYEINVCICSESGLRSIAFSYTQQQSETSDPIISRGHREPNEIGKNGIQDVF